MVMGGFMYLQRNGLYKKVSLGKLAENYRQSNNENPTLIVDFSSRRYIKYFTTDTKYGWNLNFTKHKLKSFVGNLRRIGIEPLFYFKGRTGSFSREIWQSWIRTDTERIKQVFDSLKSNIEPEDDFIQYEDEYVRFILKFECEVSVFCLSQKSIFSQLADIARRMSDCIGILSQSPDIIVFDTKPLLGLGKLDFKNMTTLMYTHSDFFGKIGLSHSQLKLLCSLAGNVIIDCTKLYSFHEMLGYKHGEYKDIILIEEISKWIKDNSWNGDLNELPRIAKISGISEEELRESIDSFEFPNEMDEQVTENELKIIKEKCEQCELPFKIYQLLRDKVYEEEASFEDITHNSIPSSALIFREMRRKVYRILFNQDDVVVKEWCFYRDANLDEPDEVTVHEQEFDGDFPSLEEMLLSDDGLVETRWQLFSYCVDVPFSIDKMKEMNPTILSLCCILHYLLNHGVELESWEIKAFICQAINLNKNEEYLNETNVIYSARTLHLRELLKKGMQNLMYVLTACGFPYSLKYVMPWRTFDDTLFIKYYNMLSNEIPEDHLMHDNSLDILRELCEVIMS